MSKKSIKKKKIKEDCWQLDMAFYDWLRERLPVYLKDADKIIDLEYYKQEHRGELYTQKEAIKKMIYLLNQMQCKDEWDDGFTENRVELMELWSQWIPAMWW